MKNILKTKLFVINHIVRLLTSKIENLYTTKFCKRTINKTDKGNYKLYLSDAVSKKC